MLPNGVPSQDTFRRFFSNIDPEAVSACFAAWVHSIAKSVDGSVVAIDGKTLRRSFDRNFDAGAIHRVSAWSAENQMVLGQVKVDKKSNEISATPEPLRLLALKGAIVTIDATGCQKAIAKQIISAQADYVLAVKDNQPALYAGVKAFFEEAAKQPKIESSLSYYDEESQSHGRAEKRHVWAALDLGWMNEHSKWLWAKKYCYGGERENNKA